MPAETERPTRHESHARHREGGCYGPDAGQPRGFIQARVLLYLFQEPGHGYALLERLRDEPGMAGADPGLLYRTLRRMEADGLLASRWDTEGQGPARRAYEVTTEGIAALHVWAARIAGTRERIERFLVDYQATVKGSQDATP